MWQSGREQETLTYPEWSKTVIEYDRAQGPATVQDLQQLRHGF
jgi:hypothetical protein